VYVQLAARAFGVPTEAVSASQRQQAKVVSLGIVYGLGVAELAHKLCLAESAASRLRAQFLEQFPGVQRFLGAARAFARRHGFVLTLAGRRRYLPDIASELPGPRAYAERQAVNSVVQGSAADVIKMAMIVVSQRLGAARDAVAAAWAAGGAPAATEWALARTQLLLQVHDELVLECPRDEEAVRSVAAAVRGCLETDTPRALAPLARPVFDRARLAAPGAAAPSLQDVNALLGASPELSVPLLCKVSWGVVWSELVPL
jgi:DNA polymerase-1